MAPRDTVGAPGDTVGAPGDKRNKGGILSRVRLATECDPSGSRRHNNGSV